MIYIYNTQYTSAIDTFNQAHTHMHARTTHTHTHSLTHTHSHTHTHTHTHSHSHTLTNQRYVGKRWDLSVDLKDEAELENLIFF